ncbi:MAG TPA: hypothetical protein VMS29_00385 [Pyrinomonadaceae bacterium]|nr:hypothetical protein [Pyrinomonadaceae bacterium]
MKYVCTSALLFVALAVLSSSATAQGGWRQWDIYLVDGTKLLGTPLGINEKGRFTQAMGDKDGIDRSKISYLAIIERDLPPAPEGLVKQDLVVLRDGTKSFGPVSFRDIRFSEGTVLQNGKEIGTEKIAYIKFANPKRTMKKKT